MKRQWVDKIEQPLSAKEVQVLAALRNGAKTYQEVGQITGIRSGHCNNILTKLKRRGLIEKIWIVKEE